MTGGMNLGAVPRNVIVASAITAAAACPKMVAGSAKKTARLPAVVRVRWLIVEEARTAWTKTDSAARMVCGSGTAAATDEQSVGLASILGHLISRLESASKLSPEALQCCCAVWSATNKTNMEHPLATILAPVIDVAFLYLADLYLSFLQLSFLHDAFLNLAFSWEVSRYNGKRRPV